MSSTPLPTASPASLGFSPERLDRVDDAMRAEVDAGHYAAISVMVARHGKLASSAPMDIKLLKLLPHFGKTRSSASPR
jgi:CubicO group peptidase (beta-lactamase class C family)